MHASGCRAAPSTGAENPDGPADPLIVHPDVRRALMDQKAFVEGGRAFMLWAATLIDAHARSGDKAAEGLVSLLTPVVKGFLTDKGFESTVQAQQMLGGHGYIEETGVSQFVRDARIAMIYEGANGVQALDLVGRKLGLDGGKHAMAFFELVKGFIKANEADARLKAGFLDPLKAASKDLQAAAMLLPAEHEDPERGARRLDRLPAPLRPRLPRLHVGADGQGGARRPGRLPPGEARHRALLHGPPAAGDDAAPRAHPVRRRAGDGAARRSVLMAEYRLHCFAQSGNSYKPALLLALAGADWEPAFVDFFNGGTRTPEYRAINAMGEAPVLEHGGPAPHPVRA